MKRLTLLVAILWAACSFGQITTNTYETAAASCTVTSDLQVNCPSIAVTPSGTLNLTISSYDLKNATFSNGLATWTLASDGSGSSHVQWTQWRMGLPEEQRE